MDRRIPYPGPTINTDYFPNTMSSFYWSSTNLVIDPGGALSVYFINGSGSSAYKLGNLYVRAVRGGHCGSFGDSDGDGICDDGDDNGTPGDNPCTGGATVGCDDNCPNTPNQDQFDTYPPGGNGCGDACECVNDLNDDGVVNPADTNIFFTRFPRNPLQDPCTNLDPCIGDLNCDQVVNPADTNIFFEIFPRNALQNPCPSCSRDGFPCEYPEP